VLEQAAVATMPYGGGVGEEEEAEFSGDGTSDEEDDDYEQVSENLK